jgi:adenosylcobinamide-GDP ribazoletransferase
MITSDRQSLIWSDLLSALGLLTRLPIRFSTRQPRGAEAAWAWPVAGAVVGTLAALAAATGTAIGLSSGFSAVLVLTVQAIVTGAMHEDGLADTADGFWGGWTRERRLEIMKDSHIGTFGVLALIFSILARWTALTELLGGGYGFWGGGFWLLIAVGALSRAPMALMLAALPNARGSGLAKSVGRPAPQTAIAAVGIAALLALPGFGFWILPAVVVAFGVALGVAFVAQSKIGGQTGDVLGATQQMSELAVLAMAAALTSAP